MVARPKADSIVLVGASVNLVVALVWPIPSTYKAFWELTAFGVVGTPKLSELGARAIPGWVTHWEVARELLETKP